MTRIKSLFQDLKESILLPRLKKDIGRAFAEYDYKFITDNKKNLYDSPLTEKLPSFFYLTLKLMFASEAVHAYLEEKNKNNNLEAQLLFNKMKNKYAFTFETFEKLDQLINEVENSPYYYSKKEFPYKNYWSNPERNRKLLHQLFEDFMMVFSEFGIQNKIPSNGLKKVLSFCVIMHNKNTDDKKHTHDFFYNKFLNKANELIETQILRESNQNKISYKTHTL